MVSIVDNFLSQENFDGLQSLICGETFPWYYNPYVDDHLNDIDKFQFVHLFYLDGPLSPYMEQLNLVCQNFTPLTVYRIKANLLTKTSKIIINKFHTDIDHLSEEKQKQWTTSILYINTNNGYTLFEDGTKVKSVANRMVTFPSNIKHKGTTCTDENTRIVINFNYFSHDK